VIVPEGNWFVDCGDLRISRSLVFEGGNIVFAGDVSIGAGGRLQVNTNNTASYSWWPGGTADHQQHSGDATWVYMKNGIFSKAGGASVELNNTMMYMSATSELKLGGGAGTTIWTAPLEGPFKDLALWSDSAFDHSFAGAATLALEGIFFTPLATMVYTGNGGQASVHAQFVANKASLQGNGSLRLAPLFNRAAKHPPPVISSLVR
jgi:hypothetical protein